MEKFEAYLQQTGRRLPLERRTVAKIVFRLTPPIDVEIVLDTVEARQLPISRSTVYRTLMLMEESGVVGVGRSSEDLSPLCESAHAKLIAGRCPWCRQAITHGQPADPGQ